MFQGFLPYVIVGGVVFLVFIFRDDLRRLFTKNQVAAVPPVPQPPGQNVSIQPLQIVEPAQQTPNLSNVESELAADRAFKSVRELEKRLKKMKVSATMRQELLSPLLPALLDNYLEPGELEPEIEGE